MPGNQHRAQRPLDRLPQPMQKRASGGRTGTEGLRDLRTVQTVPVGQIQNLAVPIGQTGRGLRDQRSKFSAGRQRLRPRLVGGSLRKFVGSLLASTFPNPAQCFVAGDGVEPGPQFAQVAQAREPRGGGAECVLNAVSRGFTVAQHADAEVEQTTRITVVDFGKRTPVTGDSRLRKFGITHVPVG